MKKTPSCTFEELETIGSPLIKINDTVIGQLTAKHFSTGSYGLGCGGPVILTLPDGKIAKCQVSINITVANSKEAA